VVVPISLKTALVALLAILACAGGITFKPFGIALVVGSGALLVCSTLIRRPIVGFWLMLIFFPIFPLFRSWAELNLPLVLMGIKFWPDALLGLVWIGIVMQATLQRRRLKLYGDDWPALVWIIVVAYGSLIAFKNQHPFVLLFGWHYALPPVLGYLAIRQIRPSARDASRTVRLLLITYVVLTLLSLVDFLVHPEFIAKLAETARPEVSKWAMNVDSGIGSAVEFWKRYARMQSLLFEENVFGSLSAFVSLYCLSWFTLNRRAVGRFFWLWALSTAALLLSVSRGSTVGWVVGVIVLLILWRRYSWRLTMMLSAVTVLAAGGLLFLSDSPKVKFWMQMIENTGVLDGKFGQDRAHQWKAGLEIFLAHPSGTGLGSAGYAASRSGAASTIVADGNYIAYLAELGIPGALGLIAMLLGLFWVLGRWQRTTDDPALKALGMALIAYLAGECVHAVSANVFEYYYTWPVFWMLVGVYVCRCEAGRPSSPSLSSQPCGGGLGEGSTKNPPPSASPPRIGRRGPGGGG